MGIFRGIVLLSAILVFSCMAKTYKDEVQSEVDSLKTTTKNIDDRYNSKYEILSEKIKNLTISFKELEKLSNQNRADTDVLIEDLKVEIQTLKGNIEEMNHRVSVMDTNTSKALADSSQRMSEMEGKFEIILTHLTKLQSLLDRVDTKVDKGSQVSSSDVSEYDSIIKLITDEKDFDGGSVKLEKFIASNPSSSLADNAQYWLGECFYAKGDYRKADTEFSKLLKSYPSSDKRCAALLKKALTLEKMNDNDASIAAFKEVIRKCPDSSESGMARERIVSKTPPKQSPKKKP